MNDTPTDVVIIGCGPGGSTAANLLARAGRRVTVLEREKFPRFHIGESLLPYNRPLLAELGVLEAVEAAGFPRKRGARFDLGNGTASTRFEFAQGRFTTEPEVVQVERAIFDQLLMQQARSAGADVREGWIVRRVVHHPDRVEVEAAGPDGAVATVQAKFVIDASGRGNVTGNLEGIRVVHPRHRKLAVFGHFTGVRRDPGPAAGDTVIIRLDNKWFWLIPIGAEKTSVGLVLDAAEFAAAGGDARRVFQQWVDASPAIRDRLVGAECISDLQITADFSYYNRHLVGPRLARIGDAAGFMDPIFSAGVFLAMWSGRLAAELMNRALARSGDARGDLARYERRVRRAMRFYWRMVEAYYTPWFMELFLQPHHRFDIPASVNAVLAGNLEPGWRIRWRLALFFLLVRIQKLFPLAPRLNFATAAPASPAPAEENR